MTTLVLLTAIAARTAIVLTAVGVGFRFLNKRHVGEMRLHDILLVLMAANAVQNAMTKGDGRILVALTSAATLVLVGWFVAVVFEWLPSLERRLGGQPVVLVYQGNLLRRNLRRERIDQDEIAAAVRKQGILRLADVQLAVLESNGSISVVPKEPEGGGR